MEQTTAITERHGTFSTGEAITHKHTLDGDSYCRQCRMWLADNEPDPMFDEVRGLMAIQACHNFWVPGEPGPGGSKTFMPARRKDDRIVVEMNTTTGKEHVVGHYVDAGGSKTKAWRTAVTGHGRYYAGRAPLLDGPIGWMVVFYQTRPKRHYRTGKFSHLLRDDAPAMPIVNPDLTKLLRSTEDALKGVLWTDDNRIATEYSAKRYGPEAGARIIVWGYA